MNNIDEEYELFKSLCNLNCIELTDTNKFLLDCIKQKGLKLKHSNGTFCLDYKIIPLSEKAIRAGINSLLNESINNFDILYETSSTNKIIAGKQLTEEYSVLLTEFQNKGQGRRNRQWVSPLADNIYLSIRFNLVEPDNIHLIPLLTALSICSALNNLGIDGCLIKWPNDIYLSGKKLAGILVESYYNKANGFDLVVGIGLNVNMQFNDNIDQVWTSLRISQNKLFDRNIIISEIISETLQVYNKLSEVDLVTFVQDWNSHDYLYNSDIIITNDEKSYTAVARGISSDGALQILESGSKTLKKIYSADVSVKTKHSKV